VEEIQNRIQEQVGTAEDRKPTYPEGQGPLLEDVNAATKFPENEPIVPSGNAANPGKRREAIWSELHFPKNAGLPEVDPRSIGDPVADARRQD
jgi:hypothetical protein